MMLHAKYQGSRPFGLGQEDVLMVSLCKTCDPPNTHTQGRAII